MARSLRILAVLVGLLVLLSASPAATQETLGFEIDKKARLVDGGNAVDVQTRVTCPAGAEVLEAFLYVTQAGNQSRFASVQPICDGAPHSFTVRAEAVDFVFHHGKARVSGYLLLTTGQTTSPTRGIKLHD